MDEEMFDEPEGTDANHERVLEVFNRHPARAVSARELGIMMDEGRADCESWLEEIEDAGFIMKTNELDGAFVRYRLQE